MFKLQVCVCQTVMGFCQYYDVLSYHTVDGVSCVELPGCNDRLVGLIVPDVVFGFVW